MADKPPPPNKDNPGKPNTPPRERPSSSTGQTNAKLAPLSAKASGTFTPPPSDQEQGKKDPLEAENPGDSDKSSDDGTVTTSVPAIPITDKTKYWVLQANPERYDLSENAIPDATVDWHIARHYRQMKVGDIVYYWQSGDKAGIYAWGTIVGRGVYQEDNGQYRVETQYQGVLLEHLPKDIVEKIVGPKHQLISARAGASFAIDKDAAVTIDQYFLVNGANFIEFALERSEPAEISNLDYWQPFHDDMVDLGLKLVPGLQSWTILISYPNTNEPKIANIPFIQFDSTHINLILNVRVLDSIALRHEGEVFKSNVEKSLATSGAVKPAKTEGNRLFPKGTIYPNKALASESGRAVLKAALEEFITAAKAKTSIIEKAAILSAITDNWTTKDSLGYRDYAVAASQFLKHRNTEAPLSIGIQAPWGAGKTSLMRMIQENLDPEGLEIARVGGERTWQDFEREGKQREKKLFSVKHIRRLLRRWRRGEKFKSLEEIDKQRWISIWFNPWKYESSEQVWAGLADAIIKQIAARLTPFQRECFYFELTLRRVDVDAVRQKLSNTLIDRTWVWASGLVVAAVSGFLVWVDQTQSSIGFLSNLTGWLAWPYAAVTQTSLLVVGGTIGVLGLFARQLITNNTPAIEKFSDFVSTPDYASDLGYRHHAEEDLNRVMRSLMTQTDNPTRIVIFIDDLDRCSPNKVAEVFEALNLFVSGALPSCYFVLGMDGEIVAAALEKHYSDTLGELPSYSRADSLGWHFLDKFIQIPFVIPPAKHDLLDDFAERKSISDAPSNTDGAGARDANRFLLRVWRIADWMLDATGGLTKYFVTFLSEQLNLGSIFEYPKHLTSQTEEQRDEENVYDLNQYEEKFRPLVRYNEKLDDEDLLKAVAKQTTWHFNYNPRTIKRFLNLGRYFYLIRQAKQLSKNEVPSHDQVIRWVYFSFRWPDAARWLQLAGRVSVVPNTSNGDGDEFEVSFRRSQRRLQFLTDLAAECAGQFGPWTFTLEKRLELDPERDRWHIDESLFDFFTEEGQRHTEGKPTLAKSAEFGLW